MAHPVLWFEVMGTNGEALRQFYGGLFDWRFKVDGPDGYGVVDTGVGRGIPGGVAQVPAGQRPYGVTFYVETPDITASLGRAEALGGKTLLPRTKMPNVTLGMFADPEGHVVGLIEPDAA